MQTLATTVTIIKDPRAKQRAVNERLAEGGQPAPANSAAYRADEGPVADPTEAPAEGPHNAAEARAVSTSTHQTAGTPVAPPGSRVIFHGPSSGQPIHGGGGIPAQHQPPGCRVTIHTPIIDEEIAPGVRIHHTAPVIPELATGASPDAAATPAKPKKKTKASKKLAKKASPRKVAKKAAPKKPAKKAAPKKAAPKKAARKASPRKRK